MNLYIVTGTTKGLGAALQMLLAADKNNTVISLSRLTVEKIAVADTSSFSQGDVANPNIHADFGDIASVEDAFLQVAAYLKDKQFDQAVLINNAGVVMPVGAYDTINSAALVNNISVNLVAPMIAMRRFAELSRATAKHRLIINISSGAAKRAIAGWSAYCAAKAGLEMATQVAAIEAASSDPTLSICALAPGVIDTAMQGQVRTASADAFPDVARFRAMKTDGTLRAAADVARDIVQLIQNGRLTHGGLFDIRNFTGSS